MRRPSFSRACVLAVLVAGIAGAASAPAQTPPVLAFGRSGGDIVPVTGAISATAHVTPTGATVRKQSLPPAALAALRRLAAAAQLSAIPSLTLCPPTLPDFAAAWVRVGAHRVAVRGSCRPAFSHLYASLVRAVGLIV